MARTASTPPGDACPIENRVICSADQSPVPKSVVAKGNTGLPVHDQ